MSEKILIADDSLRTREAAAAALAHRGGELELVADGQAALERLKEARPTLAIVDIHMAKKDGYTVCREAKTLYPGLAVLLLVGTFELCDDAKVEECGADGILRKPFGETEISKRVARILGPIEPARSSVPMAAPAPPSPAPPTPPEVAEVASASQAPTLTQADVERVARQVLLEMGGHEALERRIVEAIEDIVRETLAAGAGSS